MENGDLKAVVSCAFVLEAQLGDFMEIRNILRDMALDKKDHPNFRLIHGTFSKWPYFVVRKADYEKIQELKEKEKIDGDDNDE